MRDASLRALLRLRPFHLRRMERSGGERKVAGDSYECGDRRELGVPPLLLGV